MKIAQVIPFFAPAWGFGGPVKVSFDLSRKLTKRGHKVTALTTDAYDHTKRINQVCEEIDGIKIMRFRNFSNYLAKNFNLFLPIGFGKYFRKHIEDYDIVHLHAFFTILNAVAATICIKSKTPYILHLHESPIPLPIFGKVFLKKVFNFLVGGKMLLGASRIFVLTAQEKKNVIDRYPMLEKKIVIIPNTIQIKNFANSNKTEIRKQYGIGKNEKIILSLSRLSRLKRIDLVIRSFSKIRDPLFRLLIVGPDEGNNKKQLEKLTAALDLQDKIIFWGPVEGKEKEDIYNLSDIYILLSEYESFSITCLEAIEHNLPVCLSNKVGVAKELLHFHCGILITEPSNAQKCSRKIKWGYNNRAKLKKNCQAALKQFDMENVINKTIGIYQQVINGGLAR
ncbi:hypothetical protein COT77_01300 [Candidatus Berkelbacteria bacterium CG10_big_fil_rev_8_21_14_0_10_41_12]|uniref:Glycosyltransferase family 1 protein n=1 Tax=Candidatus Berkelbacteria bacterium CG10_big_fil_rev_8_21_14_0_10_41_12 TaxID=1974513 RepID=A0A2M6WXJ0_9BACT|nr:MAG: hypothetical protein COT77_01300 [Candidatus Berkelbacteria bacterium CG10_big_fil_rev_8_21_14_0_10_41_12]